MTEDNKSIIVIPDNKLEKVGSIIKITNKLLNNYFDWEKWRSDLENQEWRFQIDIQNIFRWKIKELTIENIKKIDYLFIDFNNPWEIYSYGKNFEIESQYPNNLDGISNLKNIKNIYIKIGGEINEGEEENAKNYKFSLKGLLYFNNIEGISLEDFNNSFIDYEIIYSLYNLKSLVISNFYLDLSMLRKLNNLKSITINNNIQYTDNLRGLINNENIKELIINNGIINNETILNISSCINLEKIIFDFVEIDKNDMILDFMPLSKLYKLNKIILRTNDKIYLDKNFGKIIMPNLKKLCFLSDKDNEEYNYIRIMLFEKKNPNCKVKIIEDKFYDWGFYSKRNSEDLNRLTT
ncbi:MAG: hypothetical protein PHV23_05745 [Candidatus Gracilibacteria bacterium]|nr:hypothetical protein [Candidatus Gracilibacteria bacterium]